eukprot:CAMPEP_0194550610 /NCGR_PEP_ID=MMETSP0253-20130528/95797_1 /TAXON_ID=2966 /ORGANISM="Noctiluca scintillans" /LENGTH=203 /DNA_ID=CAMNT_0039398049 /DNA_START=57 /DNA_END=669 /DNA_ORIENTATION=+
MTLIFLSLVALASAQITPQEIIEIGKALYTAIEDNQAVLDVSTDWAAAVPDGITDWQTLTNWESPLQSSSFYIEFKNKLGMKLTRFEWEFAWKYGGSYNGVGKYVTQAGIQVKDAYAYTSEHLDVSVTNLKPVNYGTSTAPIGGLDVRQTLTKWESPLRSRSFYVEFKIQLAVKLADSTGSSRGNTVGVTRALASTCHKLESR